MSDCGIIFCAWKICTMYFWVSIILWYKFLFIENSYQSFPLVFIFIILFLLWYKFLFQRKLYLLVYFTFYDFSKFGIKWVFSNLYVQLLFLLLQNILILNKRLKIFSTNWFHLWPPLEMKKREKSKLGKISLKPHHSTLHFHYYQCSFCVLLSPIF